MPAKRKAWPMNWHNPYISRYEQANSLFYSAEEWNELHKARERRTPTVTAVETILAPRATVSARATELGLTQADMVSIIARRGSQW